MLNLKLFLFLDSYQWFHTYCLRLQTKLQIFYLLIMRKSSVMCLSFLLGIVIQ